MNFEKNPAETPNPAENTPVTPPPAPSAPKKPASKPVIVYIMIMFIVAFLMMALSMLMHQRTTSEGIGELQHSFSAMADMQAHQEKVIQLQEELSDAAEEKTELEAAIAALEEEKDTEALNTKAMMQLYILQLQFQNGDYDDCRNTIQTMETLGLTELLPSMKEYTVPSPAETYESIKLALETLEAELPEDGAEPSAN